MQIYWEFLPARFECLKKGTTMYVHLQQDMSLTVNKDITLKLPILFKIKSGAVALDILDKRLVPMSQIFMSDSPPDGLPVTFYNRSYQMVNMKAGHVICILRYL